MKKFLKISVITVAAFVAVFGSTFLIFARETTKLARLDKSLLPDFYAQSTVLSKDGDRIDENVASITPDTIPENLRNAVVALEDKRFYSHKGVDYVRVLGATIQNIKKGQFSEGASTITQQLVKNTHLTTRKTVKRKLREMKIAKELERNYEKTKFLQCI
jgi:Membrane carboxypeptidase (penicillin-binding protein)